MVNTLKNILILYFILQLNINIVRNETHQSINNSYISKLGHDEKFAYYKNNMERITDNLVTLDYTENAGFSCRAKRDIIKYKYLFNGSSKEIICGCKFFDI